MRSFSLGLAMLALAVAACTGGGSASSSTTAVVEASSTTGATTTTTAAVETTTTSSTVRSTSSTTLPPAQNSPLGSVESFSWTFSTEFSNENGNGLLVQTEGVYVDGDFRCSITAGVGAGDLSYTYGLVMLGDDAWFDDGTGSGFEVVDSADSRVTDAAGICAGSDIFWSDITGGDPLPPGGEIEERNGIQARRLDLTGILTEASGLGLFPGEVDGVDFDELIFWVAEDGDWVTAVSMRGTVDAGAYAALTGTDVTSAGGLSVSLDVTDVDDPELTVSVPG